MGRRTRADDLDGKFHDDETLISISTTILGYMGRVGRMGWF